jgi:uncharacterized delta-60 repeat protein
MFDHLNRNYIARLNSDGTLDLTFDPGLGADALVVSLSTLADGRVVLGGVFNSINGVAFNHVGRLLTNGAPDPSFSPSGFNSGVNAVSAESNLRVVVGGGFSLPTQSLIKLFSDGSLDLNFNPSVGLNGPVHCLLVQSNGQVLLGGAFTFINGSPCSGVARLNVDGSVDPRFACNVLSQGTVYCLAMQPDGKVVVGGDFGIIGKDNQVRLARFNADGSLDPGFDPGSGANATVFALAVQPSGKIILGGSFTALDNTSRSHLGRLLPNGSLDQEFDPGSGANNTVYAVVVLPDSDVIIGGAFDLFNGIPRNGVAKIKANDADPKFVSIAFASGDRNSAQMLLTTLPGHTYVLEASADLINWSPVATNTATGVTLSMVDYRSSRSEKRFYRAQQL